MTMNIPKQLILILSTIQTRPDPSGCLTSGLNTMNILTFKSSTVNQFKFNNPSVKSLLNSVLHNCSCY